MKPTKATSGQLRRHNRQLLLNAVYTGLADNRAALAQETGLAKPTVSDLISELIEEGLLIEVGRGKVTESGGKPPRLLEFAPTARHIIGISLTENQISGVLTYLDGTILAEHYVEHNNGNNMMEHVIGAINGLIAQLDAPLLCLGIGVPGHEDIRGLVHFHEHLNWKTLPLCQILTDHFNVPVYVGNNTELAAIAQFTFGPANDVENLVMILINTDIEIGYVLGGSVYHSGGNIGGLKINGIQELQSYLGWPFVRQRIATLKKAYPESMINEHLSSYLHIRHAIYQKDTLALNLQDELTTQLAQILAWIMALLRPNHISIAGMIADLGEAFIDITVQQTLQLLSHDLIQEVTFSLTTDSNLSAMGAVAQAVQKDLGLFA